MCVGSLCCFLSPLRVFGFRSVSLLRKLKTKTPKLIKSLMWLLGELTNFLSSLPDNKRLVQGTPKKDCFVSVLFFMQHCYFFTSSDSAWKEAIHVIPDGQHRPGSGKQKYQNKAGCSSGLGTLEQQGQEIKRQFFQMDTSRQLPQWDVCSMLFLHRLWGCVFNLSTATHLNTFHSSWTKEGTHQVRVNTKGLKISVQSLFFQYLPNRQHTTFHN